MLNELFTERWSLLLAAIEEVDGQGTAPREKLDAVASFIIDSYRHEPDLMKVIIVDVTRAANSFGRTHLPEIRRAYDLIAKIVADGQERATFRRDVDPEFASMWFYGAIEQLLSGWIFELDPRRRRGLRARARRCSSRRSAAGSSRATAGAPAQATRCGNRSPRPRARTASCMARPRRVNVVVGLLAAAALAVRPAARRAVPRLLARLDSGRRPLPVPGAASARWTR